MTVMKFNHVRVGRMDLDDGLLAAIKEQRAQTKITQIKLMKYFGNDNMKMQVHRNFERELAMAQLQETLSRKSIRFSDPEHPDNEIEDELAKIKMKLNSKISLSDARAQLRRTQSLLFKRRT
ncbi:hypothetical protein [Methanothrix sp.]|jgi:hypothetical protein|uniref:hypothetical protein n=1 Tax=Methanothrix sp. TaxID=90426 RepID=UPI002D1FAF23|nr:hypothetical protein [Methanothrix sp.]